MANAEIIESTTHTWLTKREAADRLRVSERTINAWVRDRGLPHVKLGPSGLIRFSAAALDEWMTGQMQGTA